MSRQTLIGLAVACTICLFVSCRCAWAGWREDLQSLLVEEDAGKRHDRIAAIVAAAPPFEELRKAIEARSFAPPQKQDQVVLERRRCIDGSERPYCVYVPPKYDASEPTPLFVYLHGGVSRKDLPEDPLAYVNGCKFLSTARERGWFLLCPFGQAGATWWDSVGMENVLGQIAAVKSRYNIDDDRVWLGGFSDGGSAAFLYAMAVPGPFGAFVALNGHMGVGSLDGDLSTFVSNMAGSAVYAVTTENDGLYPTRLMAPTLDMAMRAGARLTYRCLPGQHEFDYAQSEVPRIARFLDRHRRDPYPGRLQWQSADADLGRCHWIRILAIDPSERKDWHDDYNQPLVSDGVTIGFIEDTDFKGPGDRVASLVKGTTVARRIGLQEGDVIVRGGDRAIGSPADLAAYKAGLKRGSPIELEVERAGTRVVLRGTIPPPEYYYVFKRMRPSGAVRARALGTTYHLETSGVARLRVHFSPDQVEPGETVRIVADGNEVYRGPAAVSLQYFLEDFIERRDRRAVYFGYVDVDV